VSDVGSRSGAQAVERATVLLRLFDSDDLDLSITELSERSDLSVSTVHRLVTALRLGGLLDQDPRTERYRLGGLVVALGRRADQALGIPTLVPALEELAARTGESINLGMRSGNEIVILHRIASTQQLRFEQNPGKRVPIYASAMGKAILAQSTDLARTVDELGTWEQITPHTATPESLLAELAVVQERGWALNDEERDPGVRAVGVALPPGTGVPSGGVAVQGPTVRLTDERVAQIGTLVQEVLGGLT
jgi:DNA-binding IclR family transcriptional regulator